MGQPPSFQAGLAIHNHDFTVSATWDGGSITWTRPAGIGYDVDVFFGTFPLNVDYTDGATYTLQITLTTACGTATYSSPTGPPAQSPPQPPPPTAPPQPQPQPQPPPAPAPPPAVDLAQYIGHIVEWDADTKSQRTSWLVGADLRRRWIPTTAIYDCLKARGAIGPDALSAAVLSQLPDVTGATAPCRLSGWAPDGTPANVQSQVQADEAHIGEDGECAANSALLFRVRGSSEHPGADELGKWAAAAGTTLIADGWRVRDMQADYPAPGLPLWQIGAAIVTRNPISAGAALVSLIKYRNVATDSWQRVRDELVSAYQRCPQRTILLSAYSQGGIVLRYVVPHLPGNVLAKIGRIDLVADPTEQGSIDSAVQHTGSLWSRWTPEGIDTFAARKTNWFFKQTHYPSSVVAKTWQYCLPYDIVCEANPVNFGYLGGESRRHTSYDFAGIGRAAARYVDAHKSWR